MSLLYSRADLESFPAQYVTTEQLQQLVHAYHVARSTAIAPHECVNWAIMQVSVIDPTLPITGARHDLRAFLFD